MNTRRRCRHSIIFPVLGIILLTSLLFGCSSIPKGNLAFLVEITGYTAESGIEVDLRLDHSTHERTLKRSADIGTSELGSILFAGIDEGIWVVSVSVHDGEAFLGEEQFSLRARRGETIASTITAVYTDGTLSFRITSESTENGQSMELEDFETLITAGRRNGMTNLDVGTRSIAFGTFGTASRAELTYPEGLSVTAGSKGTFDEVYFNVHDTSADFFRPGYVETGDYSLILEDTKGTALTSYDSIDFLSDPTFTPEITDPPNDDDFLSDLSPVDWISGHAPEVVTVGIILYKENNPEALVHTEVSYTPQTTSQFIIPGGSIDPGEWYRVIIFTTDCMVTVEEIGNFESYRAIDLPYQAAKYVDGNITIFAYYERRVDGN